ncbi:MAG TPA: hypothetical protein VE441_03510 [Mycobacterium sp.]|nr:hypothetical protein [Mycobacterium sp.]
MSAVTYDLKFAVETIWKVGVASLALGAGLPVLFALGIRSFAWGSGGDAEVTHSRPNRVGKAVAVVIFLVVAYAIVAGIVYVIATGKGSNYDITFRHFIPEIYKKGS